MTVAPDPPRTQQFPPRFRLRKRREFLALQREGRRRTTAHFVVITRAGSGPSRLGITTTRKVGNAPQRNRIRRLVRECFRRLHSRLEPPCDVLVIARDGAHALGYGDVVDQLSGALRLRAPE